MVSKVAIIAIVAILAVPILLGYALNVEQVTETDYKASGDPVNVTPLLQSDTDYSYTAANTYQINTDFKQNGVNTEAIYQAVSNTITSLAGNVFYASGDDVVGGGNIADFNMLSYQARYVRSEGYLTMNYVKTDNSTGSVQYFHALDYDFDTNIATVTYYTSDTSVATTTINDLKTISGFAKTGSYNGEMYVVYSLKTANDYIDLSAGFRLINTDDVNNTTVISMPEYTRSFLLTVNVDTLMYALTNDFLFEYSANGLAVGAIQKETIDDVIHLKGKFYHEDWIDLYYDPSRTDNTYQIYVRADDVQITPENKEVYDVHTEFRYIGGWTEIIGEANPYIIYTDDRSREMSIPNTGISQIGITSLIGNNGLSPIFRVDGAEFRSMVRPIINNSTYNPADFKANPSTQITDVTMYGKSLIFGGNTYLVSNGKINLEGRSIPVNNLVFSSIPNQNGYYENKIGNTIISTTSTPSTIGFEGKWSASVTTQSMEAVTINKIEWKAGDFAWDGIDHNFIMAGLLASLGAFVGVGIYARRTKSSVWPLLIVCGGAALLFFVML